MAVALDTTSTYKITQNSSVSGGYRNKSIQFGDGYNQSVLDGINYESEVWNLDFLPLAAAASLTLSGILKNSVNGTSNVLSWTPPGEASTKYWQASEIKRAPAGGDYWKVTCKLTRVYPLT